MTTDDYLPLIWRHFPEEYAWYLVRERPGQARLHKVYGPFDEQEALHAGEIWGVPFQKQ